MPKRDGSMQFWTVIVVGIAVVVVVALVLIVRSRLLKIGPIVSEDNWPAALTFAVAGDPQEVRDQVKVYSLGEFVDSEYLWRMTASPERVAMLTQQWSLQVLGKGQVPRRFWHMPPSWWNPSTKDDVEFLASAGFLPDDRGLDGQHFFVMYDKSQQFLYVWCKDNF